MLALACGATVEMAAHKAGVSPSTVYRRLNDPFFQRELKKLRAEMLERASAMLTASAMESIKTLLELQKPATPAAVRLGAARATLDLGMKLRQTVELEERVDELEQILSDRKKHNAPHNYRKAI